MAEEGQSEATPEVVAPATPEEPTPAAPPADDEVKLEKTDEKIEETKPKTAKKKRWIPWTIGTIVVLAILGLVIWKFKLYNPVFNRVYAASVTFKVREDDTFVLEGAKLEFRGTTYTTDASGQVTVPQTVAGAWAVNVTKDGYTPYAGGTTLKRGENAAISISLKKEPEKLFSYKGLVTDYVSTLAMSDAQVSLAGQTTKTDAAGGFTIGKLAGGDYKLTISKDGFTALEQQVTAASATPDTASFTLVPVGTITFVSNRDGKRAIYTSTYDGKDQKQLVTPVAGTEDYAFFTSPDGNHLIFSSTRDKIASNYGTGYTPRLYMVGSDGKGLVKVSDDVNPLKVIWASNSKYVYFEAYSDVKLTNYTRRFYDLTKATTFDLGEATAQVVLSNGGTLAAYVVSKPGADPNSLVYDIKTVDIVSGVRRTLADSVADLSLDTLISFSTDDTTLFYETQNTTDGRKRFQIAITPDTTQPVALSTDPVRTYFVSPNSNLKAFIDTRDGKTDVFTVDSAGKNEKRVTTLGVVGTATPLGWDATGTYITFAVVRQGENAIYIVAATGGEVRKIADFTPDS